MCYSVGNPCTSGENVNKSEEKCDDENQDEDSVSDSGDQWYTDQNVPTDNIELSLHSPKYGFANKIAGALASFEVS